MRTMSRIAVATCALCLCAYASPDYPTATSGKQVRDFAPATWEITKQSQGDLNRDGRADTVAIAADPESGERCLIVAFAAPTAGWQLAARSDSLILGPQEGGVLGDPLQSIGIERGALVITHYGGSRDRWGCTDRFRYQDGEFFHIGHTSVQQDNLERTAREIDTNLLTGRQVQTDRNGDKPPKITTRKVPIRPLGNMETYKPCGE